MVYLGADKYEVQSVTEDRVTLQNVQFPILMQAYNHTKLSELLNKNPANDHLKVVVTDRQKSETLTEKKPDSLEFSIGFSEHPCFYADGLDDDIEISFALGNKLLGILDEKQHRERQDESKKVGWYKKTDFQINAVINGENFRYDGRFDIGDGEGDLIAHLKNYYDYCLSPNCPFIPEWKKQGEDAYRKKMESLRWGREVFIPYLEQHTELSQEDATYLKCEGKDYKGENLLSLSGVYQPKKELKDSTIPIALSTFLKANPQIKTLYLHLDNDNTGRRCTAALKVLLQKDYEIVDAPPPVGKDVNDFLLSYLGIGQQKTYRERGDAR